MSTEAVVCQRGKGDLEAGAGKGRIQPDRLGPRFKSCPERLRHNHITASARPQERAPLSGSVVGVTLTDMGGMMGPVMMSRGMRPGTSGLAPSNGYSWRNGYPWPGKAMMQIFTTPSTVPARVLLRVPHTGALTHEVMVLPLAGIASCITGPALIMNAENAQFFKGQPQPLIAPSRRRRRPARSSPRQAGADTRGHRWVSEPGKTMMSAITGAAQPRPAVMTGPANTFRPIPL